MKYLNLEENDQEPLCVALAIERGICTIAEATLVKSENDVIVRILERTRNKGVWLAVIFGNT